MSIPVNVQAEVAGFFKIEAINEETGERRVLADWFPNLILDQGLNRLGNRSQVSILAACQVGAGSTPPTTTDTQLETFVASTATVVGSNGGNISSSPYYSNVQVVYRFAQGTAAGNLSEVGVGWNTSSTGSLFSRSLIKNSSGVPITITVLPGEALDVTYEFRLYPPLVDNTFSVNISGTNYDCIMRAAGVTGSNNWSAGYLSTYGTGYGSFGGTQTLAYDGPIGSITAFPSGNGWSIYNLPLSTNAYSNNSYQSDGQMVLGLGNAVFATGIRSVAIPLYAMYFQCQFTPAIPKLTTQILTLNFRLTWARRP
jgi:hypothetical protein